MKRLMTKLIVLSVLAFLVLALRFLLLSKEHAMAIIFHFGYWIMLLGSGVFFFALGAYLKRRLSWTTLQRHKLGLMLALLGTVFIEAHEPRQFKVLYDEFVLSGIARNMHYAREATFSVAAHDVADSLEIHRADIDKRPLFFPFLISCIHDLTGYRPGNVFILNGLATFLLLFFVYYFGVQYGGALLGCLCMGLLLGLPLLAQTATSGGYDVFNLLMIMLFWYFAREYLRRGGNELQGLLVLTAVHLAQVRYESILFVVPFGLILLVRWRRDRTLELSWITALSPLFLFIPLMINLFFMRSPVFMQTLPDQAFFGLQYLQGNLEQAIWYLFNPSFNSTSSVVLSAVGVVAGIVFLVRTVKLVKEHRLDDMHAVLFVIGLVVVGNFVLVNCNFWGQLDDPAASRFALPLLLLFVLCFAWFVRELSKGKPIPFWLAIPVLFSVIWAVPCSARYQMTKSLWIGRQFDWFHEQIGRPEHRRALIVAHPVGPILYKHPTISLEVAEANKWRINECLKLRLYPEILVLELWIVDYKTGLEKPYSESRDLDLKKDLLLGGGRLTALSSSFKKELVAEYRMSATVVSQISRIVGVEGADAIPPESYTKEAYPFKDVKLQAQHIRSVLPVNLVDKESKP